jgi:prepilin-type processing-associated H-X9-DG protein
MPDNMMPFPSLTILLGERRHTDEGDLWMDIFENKYGGVNNLIWCAQHGRHGVANPIPPAGYSNYLFADGSARKIPFGQDCWPINQWCLSVAARTANAVPTTQLYVGVSPQNPDGATGGPND